MVVPMGAVALLVIAGHLTALHAAKGMPASRRRLRTACGVVMMITSCALAYAFGYVRPDDARLFTLSWALTVALLALVLGLAALDALNNLRLGRLQHRRIRKAAAELHRQIARAMGEQTPRTGAGEAGLDDGGRLKLRDADGPGPAD
ncbi:MAG: hypothetical protein IPJ41_16795 [Phycisphaerales bacterium]|nr:hypothetical protein [Phycisphaerales bacterium]